MGNSVLLIDDSAILRRIATTILGGPSLRSEVLTATRATEAFARACATPPNLILVDAHLAGGAKVEFCQRLLAEPRTAAIPVVLLLGQGMPVPGMSELPDNIVACLSKPFTPEQLLACVKAILSAASTSVGFAGVRHRMRDVTKEPVRAAEGYPAPASAPAIAGKPKASRRTDDAKGTAAAKPRASEIPMSEAGPDLAGEPVVTGSFRSAFHAIAAGQQSGTLTLTVSGKPLLDVHLDTGSVVVVTTEDVAAYTSGASAVLPAKVSPATLEVAADEQRASGVPFLLTLGARGLLSKAAAVDLLHQFGQRFFARVWQLRPESIRCVFRRVDALPGFALRLERRSENMDAWLLGTLRTVNAEDVAARAKHEGCVGIPSFSRQGQATLGTLLLTDRERDFSRRVNGKLDLPGIAKGMGCAVESAYLVLHRFRALEIMDYRPAPLAFMVTPRTSVRRVLPLTR